MNLHDLDKPRMAPGEFFTPEMLQRLMDNMDRPATFYPQMTRGIATYWPMTDDVVREVRQERDGYWTYTTRVTNLDLPIRVDGVFLDPET